MFHPKTAEYTVFSGAHETKYFKKSNGFFCPKGARSVCVYFTEASLFNLYTVFWKFYGKNINP